MTRTPIASASSTNQRKSGCISGAPPVMSTTDAPDARTAASTSSMVSRDMASVRFGPLST